MSRKAAALRIQLESALGTRVPAPFTFPSRQGFEMAPSGVFEIDRITGFADNGIGVARGAFAGRAATDDGAACGHPGSGLVINGAQGGLPRGALTEIVGPGSSGRTSLILSLLAQMTSREEVCALVDSSDAFDPHSAKAAGVDLKRLLWVRCGNRSHTDASRHAGLGSGSPGPGSNQHTSGISNRPECTSPLNGESSEPGYSELEQALKTTDLLLAGGGFGVVVIDLSDIPPEFARRVPLAHWFRFRRAVEHTPTALVVLEQSPFAKTCASLVLKLEPSGVYWSRTADIDDSGFGTGDNSPVAAMPLRSAQGELSSPVCCFQTTSVVGTPLQRESSAGSESLFPKRVSHACLLRGARLEVEILRSRLQHLPARRTSFEVSAA